MLCMLYTQHLQLKCNPVQILDILVAMIIIPSHVSYATTHNTVLHACSEGGAYGEGESALKSCDQHPQDLDAFLSVR